MTLFLDESDERLNFCFSILKDNGFIVKNFNYSDIKKIKRNDCLVFSPSLKINLDLINKLPNKIRIFAGNITSDCFEVIKQKEIKYINFMQNEEFVLKNANLTAEGVLSKLIENTPSSIFEQNILILGGGRVAKAVGKLFKNLKLNFTFCTKQEAEIKKLKTLSKNILNWDKLKLELKMYDVVINTIPCEIFDKKDAKLFNENCTFFEIASKKCLNDKNFKKLKYILCPSLPGKYTPKSAGNLIAEEIIKNLKEEK